MQKLLRIKTKNVAEYLRDFGLPNKQDSGSPKTFYDTASKDILYVAEIMGVDPIKNVKETIFGLNFLKGIREFRLRYDDWYQGYKHGQRTMAIHVYPSDSEPTKENSAFPLYHIPQEIQELNGQIFVEADFISILDDEPKLFKMIQDIIGLWKQVKNHQYARVFPQITHNSDSSTPQINPVA